MRFIPISCTLLLLLNILSCSNILNVPKDQKILKDSIYGIKIDLSKPWLNKCERVHGSIGLTAEVYIPSKNETPKNDFDNIYPYSRIKVCNIIGSFSERKNIIYEGDPNFSRKKNTFVEIPKFYSKRFIEAGFEYILISEKKISGFSLDPSFIEEGKELEHIYIGAYHSSIENGVLYSVSGSTPLTDKTIGEFRNLTRKNGEGFALFDFRTLSSIQTLFLIEFANKNSQSVLGDGMVGLDQPHGKYPYMEMKNSNCFIIKTNATIVLDRYWTGMNISIDKGEKGILTVRKCTNIQIDFPENGLHTICFDGSPIDINIRDSYGASAQNSGLTDSIILSGRTNQNGSSTNNTDKCAIKYRGIENLWGNVWHMLDGIYIDNLMPKIGMNIADYSDFSTKYVPLNSKCPPFENNGGIDDKIGNISKMLFDDIFPVSYIPSEVGGPQSDKNNGYGDYFYSFSNGKYIPVHGGGWDHYFRAGLYCMRFWYVSNSKWYLYGSRMIYKPLILQ